jgi:hypothetical protein
MGPSRVVGAHRRPDGFISPGHNEIADGQASEPGRFAFAVVDSLRVFG